MKIIKLCAIVAAALSVMSSCGEKDFYVIEGGKHVGRIDSLGLESIAVRIDTLTFFDGLSL